MQDLGTNVHRARSGSWQRCPCSRQRPVLLGHLSRLHSIRVSATHTGVPPDPSWVEEVIEGAAGSCSGGAPQPGMVCLHNFLQNIITSLQTLHCTQFW